MEQQGSPAVPEAAARVAFPVVGIGASAGGFSALTTLLEHMPPDAGMALVVILHLAPNEPSGADKLLQSASGMPVVQVSHTMPILPNHVYVIPPDRSLAMRGGRLVLDRLERGSEGLVAVDIFLRALADAHGEHAIGIVLSGMGSDGTAGLARIKQMGGVTIAQLPADAEQGSMPRSAIESGMADFVLAASEIPRKLVELRDMSDAARRKASLRPQFDIPFDPGPDPQASLDGVLAVLRERTGHDFTHYRRPTLLRRMERRLQLHGVPDLRGYHQLLQRDAAEACALLKDLLIGVTGFFRDRGAFDALESQVLSGLMRAGGQPLRAWVAACSTGEEAYTLAMQLAGQEGQGPGRAWQVFASDIDEDAVQAAQAGLYPASIADSVPAALLERHFVAEGKCYKVRKALRDRVLFTRHDLLRAPAFSGLDLITCRNLLIYLNPDMHRPVLQNFHFALNPGGCLMLGSAESAEAAPDLFEPVDAAHRIFRARPVQRTVRPLSSWPAMPDVRPGAGGGLARAAGAAEQGAGVAASRRGRLFSFGDIHSQKTVELAPPSVLLDANADILHVSEQAVRFLRQAGGEPTRELAALVLPDFQLPLRSALFEARKSGRPVRTGAVRCAAADGAGLVDMHILPFRDPHAEGELMLVQFLPVQDLPPQAAPREGQDESALLSQYDEELRLTRQRLQNTLEQAEAAGNDMRVFAEEMQTTVEELRAREAELAGSRAELMASRQELAAENTELRGKALDSAKAHDDLANLIASSDVATIFLDPGMRILRYTPRIADFFNVIPADIGRPLLDITNRLDHPALAEEAAKVFGTLQPMEREVRSTDGRDYIVRVHPYRTTQHRIEGAVMTFFDITRRKQEEEVRRESEARLFTIIESLPVGIGVMDGDGRMVLSNRRMHRYLPSGVMPSRSAREASRWRAWDAGGNPVAPQDFPGARALRGEWAEPGIEMLHRLDDGREIWTHVAYAPVSDGAGERRGEVLAVVTDIDVRKRSEEALRDNEATLRELMAEGLALAVWEMDAQGRVVADAPGWRARTGQSLPDWMAEGWIGALHPDDRFDAEQRMRDAVERRAGFDAELRLRGAGGDGRRIRVRIGPLFNVDGSLRKWVGMSVDAQQ